MSVTEYPHPVLQPDGEDYQDGCSFDIVFDEGAQIVTGDNIVLSIGYALKCEGLESALREGKANAHVILHCPSTSFRRSYSFPPGKVDMQLTVCKYDVADRLDVNCVIVAAEDNVRYDFEEFNQLFFENALFKVKKGALLAVTAKAALYLDGSELEKPITSIFVIDLEKEQETQIQADFDQNRVHIMLSPEVYGLYYNIENGYARQFRRILTGGVVLPVLVEAVEKLRMQFEEYRDYRWARVVTSKLEKRGIDLGECTDSSIGLADVLLGNVVEESLNAITTIIEEETEIEDSGKGVD